MSEQILAEQIAVQLRRDILRGRFLPGDTIKERDNAAELGVSRTPMREAIRILAKEGLLVLRPSRSPIVAKPSFKEVSDQVDVLLSLENLSVELACKNASKRDLAGIRARHGEFASKYNQLDAIDLFEIDMAFHCAIVDATHNVALCQTYRSYLATLWRARYLSARQKRNRARAVGQHEAILEAIVARDAVAAKSAVNDHLGQLAESIRPVIEGETATSD